MQNTLSLDVGQFSCAGVKPENQDWCGAHLPGEPQLQVKGAAAAIADGISSSPVSATASETAVNSFLKDYYCTADAWSVRSAAERVLNATNAWLYTQTRQSPYWPDKNKGYVCTFSALVVKGHEAHLFHLGDSRIYRLRRGSLEQLTRDHRLWAGSHRSYLGRALGVEPQPEIDYLRLTIEAGDLFILSTDGVHEYLSEQALISILGEYAGCPDSAAEALATAALANGSSDNLSALLMQVISVPGCIQEGLESPQNLPLPPILKAHERFDGYTIERELHGSSRSHVYLATDDASGEQLVLKLPSIDLSDNPAYLERLMTEEWVARRVDSPHVIRAAATRRPRNYLYTVMQLVQGQTLRQWMTDNPNPGLETVRGIVEQLARGLQALHRAEILHQDLRPENIMISATGTVTLIDLGAARVDGIPTSVENTLPIPGTALYAAPEYFLGDLGTPASDLFSLAVLTYHLLSGEFPYGTRVAHCTTVAAQHKLRYRSVLSETREIPAWVDATLKRALQPNPLRRHEALSEFIHDLRHPNPEYLNATRAPLLERYPTRFWQTLSGLLLLLVFYLLSVIASHT
ncbi:bifunctional protein-serine/threonine kinase/phosphatase [Microbulbifer aggregans]|uniref:bifunctional protein-serine/threonine kinase/phosphatase n=1 Tax=Microbulbifer aggregans TaxID=1769779 RepID=UPI001CFE739F|nr:bifunctional protein-serine/threonine kinase/phosphatase [Microbulbifer aggregans]